MSYLQTPSAKLVSFFSGLILAGLAHAGPSKVFQDWSTGVTDDGSAITALTANFDGDALLEACYLDKHCEWRFSTQGFQCEPGVKSVVLVNVASGTNALSTECIGELVKGTWASRISDWQTFESLLGKNQEIAFAIAGQQTTFHVIRFSLRGMTAATASIGGAINPDAPPATRPSNVRDETL